jgi:hypothetical protein
VLLSAGLPPIITVGHPGVHGGTNAGAHGCGIPIDCAKTIGELHIPKITPFGKSIAVYASMAIPLTIAAGGGGGSGIGATPKLHMHIFVAVTKFPICFLL